MKRSNHLKSLCAILLFAFYTLNLSAQQQTFFCEVRGIEKDIKSGIKIILDFGEKNSYKQLGLSNKLKIVDENGKEIKFNSMVAAANYMTEHGWEFKQAYATVYSGSPVISYIFYKKANSLEEAKGGITTKSDYKDSE